MSNLTAESCYDDHRNGGLNGISPIFLILILFCLCGGDNGLFGGFSGNDKCDRDNGFEGILPIILILCLCGGSF